MDAIEFVEEEKRVIFTPERCIGCGVCVHKCPADAIWLKKRDIEHTYPVDGMEIGKIMTKELGGDFEEIRKRLQSF
jgi:translation initiation factor RLI1